MEKHIAKLVEATSDVTVRCSLAFSDRGDGRGSRPDIGVRRTPEDYVVVDDMFWLIAGDVYSIAGDRYESISHLCAAHPDKLKVRLRAQLMLCGKFITVDLGTRFVKEIKVLNNECCLLTTI